MKMHLNRKILKRISGIVLLIAVAAAVMFPLQKYFFRKLDCEARRLNGFYLEEKRSLDVVVMGSSEIRSGYLAAEAYKETGLTSYPYAFVINPVTLWKYELHEIEKRQNPRVLVVEINGTGYVGEAQLNSQASLRYVADSMPLSLNKLKMLRDYKARGALKQGYMSYMFPFIPFHSKWSRQNWDLSEYHDCRRGYMLLRGAFTPLHRRKIKDELAVYGGEVKPKKLAPLAEKSLNEFLDECDKSSIEHIVFVNYPHEVVNEKMRERYARYKTVEKIVTERGYDFVDFSPHKAEFGLDKDHFADPSHLNAAGARQFTRGLIRYIRDRYDVKPGKQTAENKAGWENSASYIDYYYQYFDERVRVLDKKIKPKHDNRFVNGKLKINVATDDDHTIKALTEMKERAKK